jgi:protein tyrosine phosphatase (PTP) superfamily phosphohydrolase (DUF442 family)
MLNARRFDDRITIGGVPTDEDLLQLKELGYRTLVDVRSLDERFGGRVRTRAEALGLSVVDIPISREAIQMEDVERFYFAVFERGSAPLYVFSRFGKKPLAFLLLLEAVAAKQPLHSIHRRASAFGLPLEGDLWLQEFLVHLMNTGEIQPVVDSIAKLRPDLLERSASLGTGAVPRAERADEVGAALAEATRSWAAGHDRRELKARLERLARALADPG